MSKLATLHDLLVDELKDIYSAERQLVKALPRIAKAAATPELRRALENHLQQTEGHVQRLERIFQQLEQSPRGKKCKGMEGLLEEGKEVLEADADPGTRDAALIGAAQRVEHYEIAAYGTARAHARAMGHQSVAALLQDTLDEEVEADKLLTQLAEQGINQWSDAESSLQQSPAPSTQPGRQAVAPDPVARRRPAGASRGRM